MGRTRTPLVLHLGPHKTGSTAIQGFMDAQRQALAEGGVVYPVTGRVRQQHLGLADAFLRSHEDSPAGDPLASLIRGLAEEAGDSAVFASSERFWRLALNEPEAFRRGIGRLADAFDLTLLYVRRDPFEQRWSAIRHRLRDGWIFNSFAHLHASVATYYPRGEALLRSLGVRLMPVGYDAQDQVGALLAAVQSLPGFRGLEGQSLVTVAAPRLNADPRSRAFHALLVGLSNVMILGRAYSGARERMPAFITREAGRPLDPAIQGGWGTDGGVPDVKRLHATAENHQEFMRALGSNGVLSVAFGYVADLARSLPDGAERREAAALIEAMARQLEAHDPRLWSSVSASL